jgi:hypothetical protein
MIPRNLAQANNELSAAEAAWVMGLPAAPSGRKRLPRGGSTLVDAARRRSRTR